jgi:hypothetical protein
MTPPEHDADRPGDDDPQDSILGSLPRSRPSVRSPRRDQAARARRSKPAGPKRDAKARSASTPRPERGRAGGSGAPGAEAEDGEGGAGDLARAGVTTAVQVASAGLRFAGKAAGAIRESLERR